MRERVRRGAPAPEPAPAPSSPVPPPDAAEDAEGEKPPATPPEKKQRTKQLLWLLERALDTQERDRLMNAAYASASALRKAC